MFGTLKGRILVILAVLATAGWYVYSNGLKLGLDLQGGMHLALEVADSRPRHAPMRRIVRCGSFVRASTSSVLRSR